MKAFQIKRATTLFGRFLAYCPEWSEGLVGRSSNGIRNRLDYHALRDLIREYCMERNVPVNANAGGYIGYDLALLDSLEIALNRGEQGRNKPLICQVCGTTDGVERRQQNTCYTDEESNYATLCEACQADADEYWQERWADYYAGAL